jgi:hypothetical protein
MSASMTKLVDIPASSASQEITPLGSIEAYDAVLNDDYAFAAFKENDKADGAWRVRIKGRHMTGMVFEPEAMRLQARAAGAQGKPFFTWGAGIDPSAGDGRCIQYRVHVKDGKPSQIEVFVQTRKFDGSPEEAKSLMFSWPA